MLNLKRFIPAHKPQHALVKHIECFHNKTDQINLTTALIIDFKWNDIICSVLMA